MNYINKLRLIFAGVWLPCTKNQADLISRRIDSEIGRGIHNWVPCGRGKFNLLIKINGQSCVVKNSDIKVA